MYGSEIGGGSFFSKARKALKKGISLGKKAAESNMFSSGLNKLGELTGNEKIMSAANMARNLESYVPVSKKVAVMEPNAPPAAAPAGSGYRRRRFYH